MKAGILNKKISIRTSSVSSRDEFGAEVLAWSTPLKDIWASVEPLQGRELFQAQQVQSKIDTKFIIRYATVEIEPKMRVVFNSKEYNIESVIDPFYENRELQLLCSRIST